MNWVVQIFKYIWVVLAGLHIPVWMTIVAVIFGVFIANWWLPNLNARFENARIRSEYLLNNLKTLNTDVGVLVREIGTLNRDLVSGPQPALVAEKKELVLRLIADLQWRSIEFDIIIPDQNGKIIVKDYSADLDIMRHGIESAKSAEDVGGILCGLRKFVPTSHRLLAKLAAEADVNLTLQPDFDEMKVPNLSCEGLLPQS